MNRCITILLCTLSCEFMLVELRIIIYYYCYIVKHFHICLYNFPILLEICGKHCKLQAMLPLA